MLRGEIWWANLPRPSGRRPVLLLTRNSAYDRRTSITVAPITRSIRGIPVEVLLDESDGMPQRSIVNLDDIATVPKGFLAERITTLSAAKMVEVAQAINYALDLGFDQS